MQPEILFVQLDFFLYIRTHAGQVTIALILLPLMRAGVLVVVVHLVSGHAPGSITLARPVQYFLELLALAQQRHPQQSAAIPAPLATR